MKKILNKKRNLFLLLCFFFSSISQASIIYRVEAEKAGEGDIEKKLKIDEKQISWKVEKTDSASEGAFLGGTPGGESHPISVNIPHSGKYRIWVRHYQTQGKPTGFFVLFRDDYGENVGIQRLDWIPATLKEKPYQILPVAPKDAKPTFVWNCFDLIFERPMEATVSFGPAGGIIGGKLGIDCILITDDLSFNPDKIEPSSISVAQPPLQKIKLPDGMKTIPVFPFHTSFFSSISDPYQQFLLVIVNQSSLFFDHPFLVQLGFNAGHGWLDGSKKYGFHTVVEPLIGYRTPELYKKIPAPEGRRVNSEGQVSTNFSYSYEPFRKGLLEQLANQLPWFEDDDTILSFRIADESGGAFDYADCAKERFHKWLEVNYETIEKLNELWKTKYENFAEIPLPRSYKDGAALWFAFREFSGLELISLYKEKAKIIAQLDQKKRPAYSQASGLHILSPYFTSSAPIDIEDLINIAFENQPAFGWDAYSTEDYFVGCDADFLLSLTGDKSLTNNEWNTHCSDEKITARTYWTMVGKGLKGITSYMLQYNPNSWAHTMWSLLNFDFTPKEKFAAIADANHEIRHLEKLLMPAKPVHFVKPVALYYSRMDLSIPQPVFDVYGSQIDSPYRIYEVLRGLGYPVRWVTPRLIEKGILKDIGAVIMVDVKYVPKKTAQMLEDWVKEGGCIIGDMWPGIFDEYGQPQKTFLEIFGILPKELVKRDIKEAKLAFEETTTTFYGVAPEVLATLSTEDLAKKVTEMWEQWDATHPVAKKIGSWHLSGYDFKDVKVVSGDVIGMSFDKPALVINKFGKGNTLYCASMLGTLYEAGPVHFEWDSMREGLALGRILDTFLRFSGVQPLQENDLPERIARKLRVEIPLVDNKNNVLIGLANLNDTSLSPFSLSIRWKKSIPVPKMVLICTEGSRKLQKVGFKLENDFLKIKVPGFATHAMILALNNSEPLISSEVNGIPRGKAGLLEIRPKTKIKIKVTVYNPSDQTLPYGELKLYGPPGWFCKSSNAKIEGIKPWGSSSPLTFEVLSPEICSKKTLKPIVLKYQSNKIISTPATELLWWIPEEVKNIKH